MSGKSILIASKVLTLVLCFFIVSCKNEEIGLSTTPKIEFSSIHLIKSSSNKDSIIEIEITFEDGNGDVGLSESDTASPFNFGSPYYHNLPIKFLVNDGSTFKELINPFTNQPYGNEHERVPVLNLSSSPKAISGSLLISLPANPVQTDPAEAKFEIRLIDRELNISNTVTTPSVQLVH